MKPAGKGLVNKLSLKVISEEYDDLEHIIAITTSIYDAIPEQAINDIRNTMMQLARSLHAYDIDIVERDMHRARMHLAHDNIDYIKISIIYTRGDIDKILRLITDTAGIVQRGWLKRCSLPGFLELHLLLYQQ